MAIWDKIKGEFIDIVEWTDDTSDTMVWRFERYGNEIKYGAQLTVRPSQIAVFVNEGRIADVFEPGMYTLETKNLPILSTLQGWKYGFESPFKAEVYFCNTRRFTDLKWGTKNPLMLRDPEFGMVRLRAFGTYAIRISDPPTFILEIVGTDSHFTTDEVVEQLRNMIVSRFANIIGDAKIPVLDLVSSYDKLGEFITTRLGPEFAALGIEITNMLVENISLPEEVEKALDQRTSMGIVGDLGKYMQFQTAASIPTAAANPGGLAAAGAGVGIGMAMGQGMAGAMASQQAQGAAPQTAQAPATPPPIPGAVSAFLAIGGKQAGPFDLDQLRAKVAAGEITRETLAWIEGMSAWTPAGQVPALAAAFTAVPPPLPPQT